MSDCLHFVFNALGPKYLNLILHASGNALRGIICKDVTKGLTIELNLHLAE